MLRLTRNKIKSILVLGTYSLIGSQAFAGSPIPFDNYTASNGAITAGCPTAASIGATSVTCTDGVSDNGMLQREVSITGGANPGTYIQFIVTDPGTSGDGQAVPFSAQRGSLNFVNEDFVKMNNRGSGISSKQTLIDSSMSSATLEQRFVNTHEYEFGWANSGITPWISSYQDISTVDYSADPLNPTETFSSASNIVSNGVGFTTNIDIGIDQFVDLYDANGSGAQQFKYKKVGGQYQTTSNPTNPVLPNGSNSGNVFWNPYETVSALWVGQNILSNSPGLASNGLFSHTRYLNETTGSNSALTRLDTNLPTNWANPPFGAINAIVPPHIVAPTAAYSAPTGLTSTVAASAPASGATTPVSAPITYDSWTVSNGVFTPGACPSGYTCGTIIVNERGLFQRIVADNNTGVEYVQTIVTDTAATGDPTAAPFTAGSLAFKNETFVKYRDPTGGTTGTGIATNLHIDQQDLSYVNVSDTNPLPTTGGQFAYDTKIETGWANGGPLDPTIVVDQRVYVPDTQFQQSSSMDNTFHMEIGQTQNDKIIDMSTVVGTSAIGAFNNVTPPFGAALCAMVLPSYQSLYDPAAYCDAGGAVHYTQPGSGGNNPIMFKSSIAQGALQNTSHLLTDPVLLPSNNGNIAWSAGDAIQATWVAGSYLTTDVNGPSLIGSTSYTNLSTGTRAAFTSTNADPFLTPPAVPSVGPDSWVSPFDTIGTGTPVYTNSYAAPAF